MVWLRAIVLLWVVVESSHEEGIIIIEVGYLR